MQEIRCKQCGKKLAEIEGDAVTFEAVSSPVGVDSSNKGGRKRIEIKCPHNYRNKEGKSVQCKTLNSIVV